MTLGDAVDKLLEKYLKTESVGYTTVLTFDCGKGMHKVEVNQTPADTLERRIKSATTFLGHRLCAELCDCDVLERMKANPVQGGVWQHRDACRLVRELKEFE